MKRVAVIKRCNVEVEMEKERRELGCHTDSAAIAVE